MSVTARVVRGKQDHTQDAHMHIGDSIAAYRTLLTLQQRIHAFTLAAAAENDVEIADPLTPLWVGLDQFLAVAPLHGGLHVEFHGNLWDAPFAWTLECLADQTVADALVSLSFTGPDEGANGTREWEFTPLLDSSVRFPRLRSLSIRPTGPADHNASLVQRAGTIMEEAGEIARFVAKAPHLTELVVPNAPDARFFDVPLPQLATLRIGGGYDTQHFIDNLANARTLPALALLDFSESTELRSSWAADRPADAITAFGSYARLFSSAACNPMHSFILRNSALALEELQALQALRPELQFMVIQASQGGYVSHFARDVFPWRHLVQPDWGQR